MRYEGRLIAKNQHELYFEILKKRGLKSINHYTTPVLNEASVYQLSNLDTIEHLWAHGDKYYKLADKYYKNSKYWWAIARFNKLPTESHVKAGDLIFIPLPLNEVLKIYGMYY